MWWREEWTGCAPYISYVAYYDQDLMYSRFHEKKFIYKILWTILIIELKSWKYKAK